jgi:hypothetical protein
MSDSLEQLEAESRRQTDALVALMAGMEEQQQAALLRLAEQSHKAAQWLHDYLSERQQS